MAGQRVTQVTPEVMVTDVASQRVTQVVIEVLYDPLPVVEPAASSGRFPGLGAALARHQL